MLMLHSNKFLFLMLLPVLFFAIGCGAQPGDTTGDDDDDAGFGDDATGDDTDWSVEDDDDASDDDTTSDDDDIMDDDDVMDDDDDATDDDDDDNGPVVAILDDGVTGDGIMDALDEIGVDSFIWGLESAYDGAPISADVIILANGGAAVWGVDMPTTGQQALLDFLHDGGGLLVTEFVVSDNDMLSQYQVLAPEMPVAVNGDTWQSSAETFTVERPNHPIAQGLPAQFFLDTVSYSQLSAFRGEVVISGQASGDILVADTTQGGRLVYLAFAGAGDGFNELDIWTESINMLFQNTILWLGQYL